MRTVMMKISMELLTFQLSLMADWKPSLFLYIALHIVPFLALLVPRLIIIIHQLSLCFSSSLPFSFGQYIEDITGWREDMNFMFEWRGQYLTSERSERVRYCCCHENIKFISSSQRVMFFYYMEKPIQQDQKAGIVTSLNDTTLTKVTHGGKYVTRVPDEVAYGIYGWLSSQ